MWKLLQIFTFIYFQCIFINASIPNLSVKRVDRRLIDRKRQDTLEMCRMFTEDEGRTKYNKQLNNLLRADKYKSKRMKREVNVNSNVNPTLNIDDEIRVEKIVDKMYDDMNEKGERVTYRHNKLSTPVGTDKNPKRRFNFAPSQLLGPLPGDEKKKYTPEIDETEDSLAKFKHGIVPYYIDSKTYDSDLAEIIIKAFDYFEKATCIRLQRLRERPTDQESLSSVTWLYISNPSGIRQCVHSNERNNMITKGVQMIVFGYDCMSSGDIVHELMHVLGFSHEHTRMDRDNHISIMWDNIKPGYKKYFELTKGKYQSIVESLPYDYGSVLHYPPRAFSRNGQMTILTKPGIQIGQRVGLSETDIEKVSLVYSKECIKRNKDYLLKTCPSVVRNAVKKEKCTQNEIEEYFKQRLWPFGIVNYKLKDKMEFSAEERENIRAVISHIEKETCIQFRDISDDVKTDVDNKNTGTVSVVTESSVAFDTTTPSAIEITTYETTADSANQTTPPSVENEVINAQVQTKPEDRYRRYAEQSIRRHAKNILILKRSTQPGCKCPNAGKPDGNQEIEINSDCFNSVNDLLHFFVHVLGLDHQHSMYDRDQYLHIVWKNLSADMSEEMKTILPPAASLGFPYDYQSVMHFPWLQIKNGVTNIMYPIWNDGWAMGHWQGLSSTDVQKLNLLYFNQCTARAKEE